MPIVNLTQKFINQECPRIPPANFTPASPRLSQTPRSTRLAPSAERTCASARGSPEDEETEDGDEVGMHNESELTC